VASLVAAMMLFLSRDARATEIMVRSPFDHDWRQVFGASWEIEALPRESSDETDAREGTRGACASGMVEVSGQAIVGAYEGAMVEYMQNQACDRWISQTFPERCATFSRNKWLALSAHLPRRQQRFCIDRFEYPNVLGEYPVIDINWYESDARCREQGKRLCTEDEWTFACEGEEAMPYPTGYERPEEACVIDRPWQKPDELVLYRRSSFAAMLELGRLWQGEASGSRPQCKSAFGVYDMTGNVDEWARSSISGERPSVLKGGYWGPVRTRCRPATKKHDERHAFYQQGFRCCADAP
jgi:formylglycine-generating enzyme required for sulfatase activity